MATKTVNLVIKLKDGVSAGLSKVRGGLKKLGGAFKLAAAAGAVLGGAMVAMAKQAAQFNVEMARVWTMAGGGIKNFKALRGEAKALAVEFGLAGKEIATGMYNALSAGIQQSELSTFMKTAAKVAVADGSDISGAIDGITTVLNAFKIDAKDTEKVVDQMFQTVKGGKVSFGELSKSISVFAPLAAASNIPLKEMLAHLATLTSQGGSAAERSTQLRASILGLNKALGDGWADTRTYQQGLLDVWEASGKSQSKLLELVGSSEAVMAVLGGVGINAGMAQSKLDGLAGSAGAAQEAFDKVDQFRGWEKLLAAAKSVLDSIGVTANDELAPAMESITEILKAWGEEGGSAAFYMGEIATSVDAVAEALKPVTKTIGFLLKSIKTGTQMAGGFLGGFFGEQVAGGNDYDRLKAGFKAGWDAPDEANQRQADFSGSSREAKNKRINERFAAQLEADIAAVKVALALETGPASGGFTDLASKMGEPRFIDEKGYYNTADDKKSGVSVSDYLKRTIGGQGFSIKPQDMIDTSAGSMESEAKDAMQKTNELLMEQNAILNERLGGVK